MFNWLIRYGGLLLKLLIGRKILFFSPVNFKTNSSWPIKITCRSDSYINDTNHLGTFHLQQHQVFPLDNAVSKNLLVILKGSTIVRHEFEKGDLSDFSTYNDLLNHFIKQAKIPSQWKHAGLHYAGFSLKDQQYILPSWIWTNGVVVEHYSESGQTIHAVALANCLVDLQLPCGGWVVRYDYKDLTEGVSAIVAPNDSAHCADHGLLTAYNLTGDPKFLLAAERCADWIMQDGHTDGLIRFGYNVSQGLWDTEVNIVDVGFSAALFCSLYSLTKKPKYIDFAGTFLKRYIEVFYLGEGIFSTTIRGTSPYGKGIFSRGLAWALEGLIPYYEITQDRAVGNVVEEVVDYLLRQQSRNGSWLYNLRKGPVGWFSGADNKGTPIIAASLVRWKKSKPDKSAEIDTAVLGSITWCLQNMKKTGPGAGGIFSSNFEGAIVHSPNTQVAFVYANCYLLKIMRQYSLAYSLKEEFK